MKSVFLVKTPLQLLNAIEAKHHFNISASDSVLIAMGDRKSRLQLIKLMHATDEWGVAIDINDISLFSSDPFVKKNSFLSFLLSKINFLKTSFFYVRRLNRVSKYLKSSDYVFVGYTGYIYMTHFINIMPHNKLVFLDDGNGTYRHADKRRLGGVKLSGVGPGKKLKIFGKRVFQGVKVKEPGAACFFSAYNVFPGDKDQVVKNNFSYIRGRIESLPVLEEVYFIGSPLSEVGFISLDNYLSSLKRIKKYFEYKKIVYIAHRRESPDKLKILECELGLKVVLFDYPIEYQLAYIGPRPNILASFFSAALDSCSLIFEDKMKIISFRLENVETRYQSTVDKYYKSSQCDFNKSFIIEDNY